MMCQHAPVIPSKAYPPYTSENPEFSFNLKRICVANILSAGILTQCLEIYKKKLLDNKWKLDIGSTYGFLFFCDLYLTHQDIQLDLQTILFVLSIASQFIDCIHGEIKLLGLRLYSLIVAHSPVKLLLESNVHKVVIKSCLDNAQKLLPDDCLVLLWDNVTQAVCLDEKGILQDLNWNELDDSLHLLFQKIKLESKREIRRELRGFLKKVVVKCYTLNHKEVDKLLNDRDFLKIQREITDNQTKNVKLFRWITDLKELFIFECLSVNNCEASTEEVLIVSNQMHVCLRCPYYNLNPLRLLIPVPHSRVSADNVRPTLGNNQRNLAGSVKTHHSSPPGSVQPVQGATCDYSSQCNMTLFIIILSQSPTPLYSLFQIITTFLRMLLVHLDQIEDNNASYHHLALRKLLAEHLLLA